jgi:hypothetical protein
VHACSRTLLTSHISLCMSERWTCPAPPTLSETGKERHDTLVREVVAQAVLTAHGSTGGWDIHTHLFYIMYVTRPDGSASLL